MSMKIGKRTSSGRTPAIISSVEETLERLVQQLKDLTIELDMELPEIKTIQNEGQKTKKLKRPEFLSRVRVGDRTWATYPEACYSQGEAEMVAIKKAIEFLAPLRDSMKKASLSNEAIQIIVNNVIKLLSQQPDGDRTLMMHTALSELYVKTYNTRLPLRWVEIIEADGSGKLTVERQSLNKELILIGIYQPPAPRRPGAMAVSAVRPNGADPLNNGTNGHQDLPATNGNAGGGDVDIIHNGAPIPEAYLPKVCPKPVNNDDYFDIVVICGATPHNFHVSSYKSVRGQSPFTRLEAELLEFYSSEENLVPLNADLLPPGSFWAAKKKGKWYRARIESVMKKDSSSQVMCKFVDYGELQMIDLADIQPLYSRFRQLPRQAIRATLSNIVPVDGDWSVIASFEFSKMVDGKPFVATVHDITEEEDDLPELKRPVLHLSIIDTSGENDFYVEDELIAKNYAVRKN